MKIFVSNEHMCWSMWFLTEGSPLNLARENLTGGRGTSLEEEGHWGLASRLYSQALHSVYSLLLDC